VGGGREKRKGCLSEFELRAGEAVGARREKVLAERGGGGGERAATLRPLDPKVNYAQ